MGQVDRGVVLTELGRYGVEDIDVEPPGPGEVLVRLEATGVCHSDLHVVETGWAHPLPALLGHEGAGVVEALGEGVDAVGVGERVVLGWRSACGRCPWCLRGDPRRCRTPPVAAGRLRRRDGQPLTPVLRLGTFATRTVVPAAAAVPIAADLAPEQACLIGCAVATGVGSVLYTAGLRGSEPLARAGAGLRVAVIGCGAVGLSVIQGARLVGVDEIYAVDVDEAKAELARRFGATHVGPGRRLDVVFDVVGRPETVVQGLAMLGHAGTLVYIGLPRPGSRVSFDLEPFFDRRHRIVVSHGGDHLPAEDFPRLAAWAVDGKLDLAGMVTQTLALDDVERAMADLRAGRAIRSVLLL